MDFFDSEDIFVDNCTGLLQEVPENFDNGRTKVQLRVISISKNFIAIGSECGALFLYNRNLNRTVKPLRTADCDPVTALELHTDGVDNFLAVGRQSGQVIIMCLPSEKIRKIRQSIQDEIHRGQAITCVRWSPDGRRLYTVDISGQVIGIDVDFDNEFFSSIFIADLSSPIRDFSCNNDFIFFCTENQWMYIEAKTLKLVNSGAEETDDRQFIGAVIVEKKPYLALSDGIVRCLVEENSELNLFAFEEISIFPKISVDGTQKHNLEGVFSKIGNLNLKIFHYFQKNSIILYSTENITVIDLQNGYLSLDLVKLCEDSLIEVISATVDHDLKEIFLLTRNQKILRISKFKSSEGLLTTKIPEPPQYSLMNSFMSVAQNSSFFSKFSNFKELEKLKDLKQNQKFFEIQNKFNEVVKSVQNVESGKSLANGLLYQIKNSQLYSDFDSTKKKEFSEIEEDFKNSELNSDSDKELIIIRRKKTKLTENTKKNVLYGLMTPEVVKQSPEEFLSNTEKIGINEAKNSDIEEDVLKNILMGNFELPKRPISPVSEDNEEDNDKSDEIEGDLEGSEGLKKSKNLEESENLEDFEESEDLEESESRRKLEKSKNLEESEDLEKSEGRRRSEKSKNLEESEDSKDSEDLEKSEKSKGREGSNGLEESEDLEDPGGLKYLKRSKDLDGGEYLEKFKDQGESNGLQYLRKSKDLHELQTLEESKALKKSKKIHFTISESPEDNPSSSAGFKQDFSSSVIFKQNFSSSVILEEDHSSSAVFEEDYSSDVSDEENESLEAAAARSLKKAEEEAEQKELVESFVSVDEIPSISLPEEFKLPDYGQITAIANHRTDTWNIFSLPFSISNFDVSCSYIVIIPAKHWRHYPHFRIFDSLLNGLRGGGWTPLKVSMDNVAVNDQGNLLWRIHKNVAYCPVNFDDYSPECSGWQIQANHAKIIQASLTTKHGWYLTDKDICVQMNLPDMGILHQTDCHFKVKNITASDHAVWGLRADKGTVIVRTGMDEQICPMGTDWVEDCLGGPRKFVTVGLHGKTGFGLDSEGHLWFINGVDEKNPLGRRQILTATQPLTGHLMKKVIPERLILHDNFSIISAGGNNGIFVCQPNSEIFVFDKNRKNLTSIPHFDTDYSILALTSTIQRLYVLDNCGNLNVRRGFNSELTPLGTSWDRLDTSTVGLPICSIAVSLNSLWIVTADGQIFVATESLRISNSPNFVKIETPKLFNDKIDQIRVSPTGRYVWIFSLTSGKCFSRYGIDEGNQKFKGLNWLEAPMDIKVCDIAVGDNVIWAISQTDKKLFKLRNLSQNNIIGIGWRPMPFYLRTISVDSQESRLWGIDLDNRLVMHEMDIYPRSCLAPRGPKQVVQSMDRADSSESWTDVGGHGYSICR